MLRVEFTNKMKRDVRRLRKRGKDLPKLETALLLLSMGAPMGRNPDPKTQYRINPHNTKGYTYDIYLFVLL